MNELLWVEWFALGDRFSGVSLDYRRFHDGQWPSRWRARCVANKNERIEYRITAYGDSPESAIAHLMSRVKAVGGP